jgi:hypothetical protein
MAILSKYIPAFRLAMMVRYPTRPAFNHDRKPLVAHFCDDNMAIDMRKGVLRRMGQLSAIRESVSPDRSPPDAARLKMPAVRSHHEARTSTRKKKEKAHA